MTQVSFQLLKTLRIMLAFPNLGYTLEPPGKVDNLITRLLSKTWDLNSVDLRQR